MVLINLLLGIKVMSLNYKICYIAGYSRSGSTILDTILSDGVGVFGAGELIYFNDEIEGKRECTCGSLVCDCPVWSEVQSPLLADYTRCSINYDGGRHSSKDGLASEKYRELNLSMFNAIATVTGARVIVDSSKSARDATYRFKHLTEIFGDNVYVIHMTRDVDSVMYSYLKHGSNWAAEGYKPENKFRVIRSLVGWMMANFAVLKHKSKVNYLQVRLEDLTENPKRELDKIAIFLDEDFSNTKKKIVEMEPIYALHKIGGNRNRFKPLVLSGDKGSGGSKLPYRYRVLSLMIAGPLMRKLGY